MATEQEFPPVPSSRFLPRPLSRECKGDSVRDASVKGEGVRDDVWSSSL